MRVLSLIEAHVVTAPAKIVLNFATDCRGILDLTVVTFARRQASDTSENLNSPLLRAAADASIPVIAIRESGRYDLGAVAQLRRLIKEYQPDIVQTNSVKSHFFVSRIPRRSFGWLAFHHGYTAENLKMRLYNQLDRVSLRACDQVVTVCRAFAEQLQYRGVKREKIRVIPNGIPVSCLKRGDKVAKEWRARLGIASDEAVLLSVGRLSPEKGHKYLIDAAALLMRSGLAPRFKVIIAGAGLLERSLSDRIRGAGLQDCVKLIGHQADVEPLFTIADVFVLPSLSEGSPMVLLESMVAKVPVIATTVGGIPETVSDQKSAVLVPPADAHSLSKAMLKMLIQRDRARQIAETAFDRVQGSFNPALYNSRVLDAFETVLDRKRLIMPEGVLVQ